MTGGLWPPTWSGWRQRWGWSAWDPLILGRNFRYHGLMGPGSLGTTLWTLPFMLSRILVRGISVNLWVLWCGDNGPASEVLHSLARRPHKSPSLTDSGGYSLCDTNVNGRKFSQRLRFSRRRSISRETNVLLTFASPWLLLVLGSFGRY